MKSLEIKGILREAVGKSNSRKLRSKNMVPCVLYGGKKNIHFTAHENTFRKIVYTPNVYLIKLIIDDKEYNTIMQDIQFHPVTDKILHIDFLEIFEDKKVKIEIPSQLNGFAEGVKEGGKLQFEHRKLKVWGFIKNIPDILEIDITNIGLGKGIQVGELSFENLELLDPQNTVIASVKLTRAAKGEEIAVSEEEVEEIEEGAEGAEDEGVAESKEKAEKDESQTKEGEKTRKDKLKKKF